MQDALHQPHAPHALRHRVAVAQPTRPGELRRHGGQQHRAVILRGDLDGLVVLVLRDPDVLRHLRWKSLKRGRETRVNSRPSEARRRLPASAPRARSRPIHSGTERRRARNGSASPRPEQRGPRSGAPGLRAARGATREKGSGPGPAARMTSSPSGPTPPGGPVRRTPSRLTGREGSAVSSAVSASAARRTKWRPPPPAEAGPRGEPLREAEGKIGAPPPA